LLNAFEIFGLEILQKNQVYIVAAQEKNHVFGWRDIYDIVIKWRQISEPNDPVWWVDLLTKEQFTEGFGSHTPMITGQCNVVRYSPFVSLSFPIMKEEIIKQKTLSPTMKERVLAAKMFMNFIKL